MALAALAAALINYCHPRWHRFDETETHWRSKVTHDLNLFGYRIVTANLTLMNHRICWLIPSIIENGGGMRGRIGCGHLWPLTRKKIKPKSKSKSIFVLIWAAQWNLSELATLSWLWNSNRFDGGDDFDWTGNAGCYCCVVDFIWRLIIFINNFFNPDRCPRHLLSVCFTFRF